MKDFSKILLKWYKIHKRPLPWRDTQDPYRIWISEIILQQTRVAQGYDYFLRFMERFPNVQTLAEAPEDEVLKYWEGLGYYSRARNLHTAAKSMNGVFPSTYEGVRALKGVGEYTAAAICSFAYRMPYAVVDGNVYRVLARLFGLHTPTDSTEGKKQIAALAQDLLDKKFPDDHNQAIMDFGATQCVPQSPNCKVCPFVKRCKAFSAGEVDLLPIRTAKVQTLNRYFTYIYVRQGGYTWLRRRPAGDIWQGLYELPMLESVKEITPQSLKKTDFWKNLFGRKSPRFLQGPVKHVLSHRVIYAWFYEVEIADGEILGQDFIKVPVKDVKKYAFPRLVQKFLTKK